MRIALTGTPGVGKSTLAKLLSEEGRTVIDLKEWAATHKAIASVDEDGTQVLDMDQLAGIELPPNCIIDGHMAHFLEIDLVWLIRCDPRVLKPRLEARGYAPAKVNENVEAEALDLVLQEALDSGARVIQRDGSSRTPTQLLSAFVEVKTDTLKAHDLEAVDWSDRLLD